MSSSLGVNSHIGWGQETTWGTAVAPTKFAELISESMIENVPRIPSAAVRNVSVRRSFAGVISAGGSATMEMWYEGFLRLLEYAMGAVATTNPGTLAYLHTYTLADAMLEGLTVEIERDLAAVRYEGCLINSLSLSMAPDQLLQATFEFLAQRGAAASPGTFVAPPNKPILHSELAVEIDSVAVNTFSAELTLVQNLLGDRKNVGVPDIIKPVRGDHRGITGVITTDLEGVTLLNKYLTADEFPITLKFTGPEIETSHNLQFWITLPHCHFTGHPANVGGPGPIEVAIPFMAMYDLTGAADAMKIEVKNSETAVA